MFSNVSMVVLASLFVVQLILMPLSTGKASSSKPADLVEPHDFRAYGMDCRNCHKALSVKTSGALVKPVTEICQSCHNLAGRLSHPVDMKPSFNMPPGLPLDGQGMMTCTTCHDPHKAYRNALSGAKTMYLRREEPRKQFCLVCHGRA